MKTASILACIAWQFLLLFLEQTGLIRVVSKGLTFFQLKLVSDGERGKSQYQIGKNYFLTYLNEYVGVVFLFSGKRYLKPVSVGKNVRTFETTHEQKHMIFWF